MKQDFICTGELHFTANRTLYVNGDAGDNANPGTEEVPYRALQVAAGTYDDVVVRGTSIQNCMVGLQAGTSPPPPWGVTKKGRIQFDAVSGLFFNQST